MSVRLLNIVLAWVNYTGNVGAIHGLPLQHLIINRRKETRHLGKLISVPYNIRNNTMTQKNHDQIKHEYGVRQGRQFTAIAVALLLVILVSVVYKRPDLLGAFSKDSLAGAQLIVIASFIGFTSYNWRCPACNKYLGNNIVRRGCSHCKTRLR